MINEQTTHLLACLEIGFRTDGAHLQALEEELISTLQCTRTLENVGERA